MDNRDLLTEGCRRMGITLSEQQIEQFFLYKRLLVAWNEKINLTAITEERDIIVKHFIDSLSVAKVIDLEKEEALIDVGTGAGFPGLPLKIAFPHLKVTLLDSLNKRIAFLNTVVEELQLKEIQCIHGRAEEAGQNAVYREQHSLCVSRAVAHLAVLSEYCIPFVEINGKFISMKGPDCQQEVEEAKPAIVKMGGIVEGIRKVEIIPNDMTHSIVMIKKVRQTPRAYPRKPGKITKNPILL